MNINPSPEAGKLPLSDSAELLPAVQVAFPQGYRLPDDCTDPNLIQRYIAAQMGRTVEACLEIGRGLVALKALCEHGEFLRILGELGGDIRHFERFMSAYRRFSNRASTPVLEAAGKQTKLFELLPLDDEQLEELAVKGRVGPLVLSEIPSMTAKAVRAAVRKVKEERQLVSDAILAKTIKSSGDCAFADSLDALQPGDRIESLHARRPGAVVKVYADGSACVCWDDGEPQEAGLGHERMPRNLLVKMAGASPVEGGVDTAFETHATTAAGHVNDGDAALSVAPEGAEAFRASGKLVAKATDRDAAGLPLDRDVTGSAEAFNDHGADADHAAAPAGTDNLRRVDAQLKVYFGGRVFDVSGGGFCVGDTVACEPAELGPFIQVRQPATGGPAYMAPMLRPVDPPPVAPPDPLIKRRKQYLLDRMKLVLRYADGPELNDIEDLLEELISDISRDRYVPGLVAADYDLTRKYWIEGSAQ